MSLQSHFEFMFVGRDEGSFLENYSYDLTQEAGLKAGKLFIALEIQNNPTDAEMIGETLADTVRRVFFGDVEENPYERLEEALKQANAVVKRFKKERVSNFVGTIHVVVGAICGNELFLGQAGDAQVYLVRNNYVSVITEGLNDDTDESEGLFVNIASGTLEKGDVVILSTARLLRYVTQSDFVKCLASNSIGSSLSKMRDLLEPEILTKIALIGISIDRKKEHVDPDAVASVVHEEVMRTEYHGTDDAVSYLDIKSRAREYWAKTKEFVGNVVDKTAKVSSDVTTSATKPKTKKDKVLAGLIVVILLLTAGIWYSKNQKRNAELTIELNNQLDDAANLISDAETRGYDKKVANELLKQAEQKIVEVRNSGLHRNKANELLEKVSVVKRDLDNVTTIESGDPEYVVANLTDKRPNVSALGIIGTDDVVYVYEYNALYEIIAGQLQDPKTIDDGETVVAGGEFADRDALVFLTKSGKVIEYFDDRFQFADSQEGAFRKSVAVDDWSNKIYLLDTIENQIWRYPYSGRSEVFGTPDAYVTNGDLSGAVDLAIDKFVYVLKGNGEVQQYLGGEIQELPIRKTPIEDLESPTKIYTDSEMNELFILEPDKNRVLVYLKDSTDGGIVYQSQYVIEDEEVRGMYFDKDDRRLYILTATRVYGVNI